LPPATAATEPDFTGPLQADDPQGGSRKPSTVNNWQAKSQPPRCRHRRDSTKSIRSAVGNSESEDPDGMANPTFGGDEKPTQMPEIDTIPPIETFHYRNYDF